MTVGVGIEVGAEIGAGGRPGAGAGPGQSQATPFALGKEKSEGRLEAASGNTSRSSVSGGESFRSNWQSMLRAWDAMPRASGGAADKDAIDGGNASSTGEIGAASGTDERGGPKNAQAASRSTAATSQGNGPLGDAKNPPLAGPQSATDVWMGAAASRRQILAGAAMAGISAQTAEVSAAADSTSSSTSTAGWTAHRNNGSERRESALEGPKAEQQAQPVGAGPLETQVSAAVAVVAVAAPAQPQIFLAEWPAAPTAALADRIVGFASEPASDAGGAESPAAAAEIRTSGRIGAAVPQTGMGAHTPSRNPLSTTRIVAQGDETSEAGPSVRSELGKFAANRQSPLPLPAGTPTEESQELHAGQASAQSGSHAVQAAGALAAGLGTYRGVEENSVVQSGTAIAGADEPNLSSGAQSLLQAAARPVHEAAGSASASAAHVAVAQPSGAAVDGSPWAHDSAGAQGAASSAPGASSTLAGSSAGTLSGPAPRETFAALDSGVGAGTAVGTPAWIHAGGQRVEAGFQDPALGWVGVRADLNGGSVHAAVVPGSSEAAQALSGHLAGLNTCLAEQHSPVATLRMAAPGGSGMESGVDQSMQQDAGQHAEQNTAAAAQLDAQVRGSANAPASSLSATSESAGFDAIAPAGERRGVHISVMA